MASIYISGETMRRNVEVLSVARMPSIQGQRHYDIAARGESLFSPHSTEFERADGIENINKAIDQRMNLLKESFGVRLLQRMPTETLDPLDVLCRLNIVKPIMANEINDIRNVVNHQDAPPPDSAHCARLAEAAWYFLRSTDALLHLTKVTMAFIDEGRQRYLRVVVVPASTWQASVVVTGFPDDFFSKPFAQCIRVDCDDDLLASVYLPELGFVADESGLLTVSGVAVLNPGQQHDLAASVARYAPLIG